MIRMLFVVLSCFVSAHAVAASAADTPGNRLNAGNHLFELPAYRQIAIRQLYESLNSLPAEQHRRVLTALSDSTVMTSLRAVISRAMAQTFSTAELEHLARFLQADDARSMIDKTQSFLSSPVSMRLQISTTIAGSNRLFSLTTRSGLSAVRGSRQFDVL